MTSSDRPRPGESTPGRAVPISRAAFLRGAAAAVAGGVAFPLLDACSGGGSASSGGGAGSGGSATAASAGGPARAAPSAGEVATVRGFIGPVHAEDAGGGPTWRI